MMLPVKYARQRAAASRLTWPRQIAFDPFPQAVPACIFSRAAFRPCSRPCHRSSSCAHASPPIREGGGGSEKAVRKQDKKQEDTF